MMKKLLTLFAAVLMIGSMMTVKADYYVAGTFNGWSTNADGYQLVLEDGIYKLNKENIVLSADETAFKVVKDNNWGTAWPGSNYVISKDGAGIYNLAFTFEESSKNVTGAATRTVFSLATASLPGRTGDWEADGLKLNSDDRIIFKALPAGTYSFKITNGTWSWNKGYDDRDESGSNITLVNSDGNLGFTLDDPRDVIIAYKASTGKITVNAYETAKVKFFAPRDNDHPWNHVYAYAWDEGGTLSAAWPGDEITSEKEAEWYVYNIRKGGNVLFHDNDGMQTNDITNVSADVCYNSTAIDYVPATKKVTVAVDGDCTMTYYIAGYKSLVGGSTDFGTHFALDENNQIVYEDVPAGEYAFKISNGSWAWSIGGNDHLKEGCASIAQTVGIGNVGFSIDHTQDITITYYPLTQEICLGAETTKSTASITVADMSVYASKSRSIKPTYTSDATEVEYEILSGNEYIEIVDGKVIGVAEGTATVRATVPETANYLSASDEFMVTVAALDAINVKFYAPKSTDYPWEHVYAYAWIEGDAQSDPWPGTEITASENNGWYAYDVPAGASVLFTDGVVMKTQDITGITAVTCYVPTSLDKAAHEADENEMIIVTIAEQCTLDYYLKNNWQNEGGDCSWSWKKMTPAEGGKFRLENVVYGGSGINYNILPADEGAVWKAYSTIKYANNKVVAAYDTVNFVLDPATGIITAEEIHKDVTVYTVAGNSLALFDLGWEPTHPWNYTDMEKQENGTYLFNNMEEEANLRAGTLEIKVIKNRDYANGSWPEGDGNNFVYNVQRSGRYDVAIHFDPCSKEIWIDTTLLNAFNIQDFNIVGSWDSEIRAFKVGGDEDKALVTIPLAVGSYTFKLQDPNNKEYGDGQAFTRANPSFRDVVEVTAGASMTLEVDKAGDYLFTYIFETEQLVITYPAIVPEDKIAPLSGEFSIGAAVTTGRMSNKVRFARGNIQYNYAENAWYAADKQYEVLGDLNLRFGDNTYQGSIDLFSWSCESSNFGTLVSSTDGDFTGAFVDWGQKFAEDENEWFTLSRSEWEYLLAREKDSHKLWTMIAIGPDSLNGLALFPDDWTAPTGLTIAYGFYDLDKEEEYKANSYTFEQWEEMEAAGAVFIPLAGTRSGHIGFTGAVSNPLTGWYCWVDNVNWMGYYWTSTPVATNTVATLILPGWHNSKWTVPQYWSRERRRAQPVRLVTRVQREPDYTRDVNGNYGTICLPKNGEMVGATIYEAAYRDLGVSKLFFDEVIDGNMEAGKPYLYLPKDGAARLEVYYTDNAAPVEADDYNGFYGYYDMNYLDDDDEREHPRHMEVGEYLIYNNQYVRVSGNNSYLAQFRAYIDMSEMPTQGVAPAPGRRRVALGYTGTSAATGIESIQPSEISIQKVMIDGQLYILRGEKMYNANGQIVK